MAHKTTIFLASSKELKAERETFEQFIGQRNKQWQPEGVFLHLDVWEDFLDAMSPTRKQDDYNAAIQAADLFVLLVHTKVGKYTREEFETAWAQFQRTGRPKIYAYLKSPPEPGEPDPGPEYGTVRELRKRLDDLGHWPNRFDGTAELLLQFGAQLDKLRSAGFIEAEVGGDDAATPGFSAHVTGGGAVAQGAGAQAAGAGGVVIGGNNRGNINTGHLRNVYTGGGAYVEGSVEVRSGHFIGRDYIGVLEQVVVKGQDPRDAQLALASYLHALTTDLAGLRLGEIDETTDITGQKPLELRDIYVPLDTTFAVPEGASLDAALAAEDVGEFLLAGRAGTLGRAGRAARDGNEPVRMHPVPALEALCVHPSLTLLGPAGSGKSTFGAHVLLTLAQAWQGKRGQLEPLGKGWAFGALLPVRVVLRRFAEQHAGSARPLSAGDLWRFIGDDLHQGGWGEAREAMKTVQRLAREHGAFVLFDGLDECGDEARRERVLGAVRQFMKAESRKSRFLLTARPYAFKEERAAPREGIYLLAELSDDKIEQFITAWYAALVKRGWSQEAPAARKRAELLGAYRREDMLPLARNPLLLTLMALLHSNRGQLPDDRAELYDEMVKLLLLRWNRAVGADRALLDALAVPGLTLAHIRSALEKLAFEVHEANTGVQGAADIAEHRLTQAFRPLLHGSKDKADQVVQFIERRAGLLVGHGRRAGGAEGEAAGTADGKADGKADGELRFSFPHRTFQEFLAACHLSTQPDFATQCRRLADANADHWRVVLTLAARLAKPERGATAADELLGGKDVDKARAACALTPAHWQRALLAGQQLQELGAAQLALSERTATVLERVRGWLVAGLPLHPSEGGASALQRAQAGDVLAALGDPRFDAARCGLPADAELGFVHVPADPAFVIGTRADDKARIEKAVGATVYHYEANETPLATREFRIARYPVTVAQFQAFVAASGHALKDPDALRDAATRPVRHVSWFDAVAYCAWLHEQLLRGPAFAGHAIAGLVRNDGWTVGLPSELEWEVTARGGLRGMAFPWGDEPDPERANVKNSRIDTTSPVGCFPANGFGLQDCAGNLWEWTRSRAKRPGEDSLWSYPYQPDDAAREDPKDQDASRVVRGGSWVLPPDDARCAYRNWFLPDDRYYGLGFRVVLRSPPVP